MRKISVILLMTAILCALILPLSSCSSKIDYDYAFVTDLHIVANSVFTSENYASYSDKEKVIHITEAVTNTLVDDLIDKDYKYVLIGGDIADRGDEASHLVAAAAFARLEKAGIDVFVVNGNHDTAWSVDTIGQRISSARFKEIYADFGYNTAIASCPDNLSYVADINSDYRLIAIDSVEYYDTDPALTKTESMSDAHIEWIKAQVEQCKVDKVTPVIITHESLLNHFPEISDVVLTDMVQYDKLTAYLADNGANYSFAGHYHMQDIMSLTTESGNTFYEAETSAMAMYPCAYREMDFNSKKITINTQYIDNVNESYLPQVCSEELKTELKSGLQAYCAKQFYNYMNNMISDIANDDMLSSLDLSGELSGILEIIKAEVVEKSVNAPYYIKDEKEGEISLERILQGYGITIAQTDYVNLSDLGANLAMRLFGGDENFTGASELELVKYSIYSIFYYLEQASDNLAVAVPDYPVINLDLEKLFKEGILECYDSNFIPFIVEGLESADSFTLDVISGLIRENFDQLGGTFITSLISSISLGQIQTVSPYFDSKNLLLEKFIDVAIWGDLASSYVLDLAPADNYCVIELK